MGKGASFLLLALVCLLLSADSAAGDQDSEGNVYSFTVKDIRGKDVKLSDYKGQVRVLRSIECACSCFSKA